MTGELHLLNEEHQKLQTKFGAAKTRNKILTSELKGLKEQMKMSVEKGTHDDELIAALMVSLVAIIYNCLYIGRQQSSVLLCKSCFTKDKQPVRVHDQKNRSCSLCHLAYHHHRTTACNRQDYVCYACSLW